MSSLSPSLGPRSIFHLEFCLCLFVVVVDHLRGRIPTHIWDQIVLLEALVVLMVEIGIDNLWQILVENYIGIKVKEG